MKKYFTYVPLSIIIFFNVVLGFAASGPFILALFLIVLMGSPQLKETCIALVILLVVVLVIFIANYVLYKLWRRKVKEELPLLQKRQMIIRLLLLLVVWTVSIGCFYILPDIWDIFYGWWL